MIDAVPMTTFRIWPGGGRRSMSTGSGRRPLPTSTPFPYYKRLEAFRNNTDSREKPRNVFDSMMSNVWSDLDRVRQHQQPNT